METIKLSKGTFAKLTEMYVKTTGTRQPKYGLIIGHVTDGEKIIGYDFISSNTKTLETYGCLLPLKALEECERSEQQHAKEAAAYYLKRLRKSDRPDLVNIAETWLKIIK